MDYFKPQPQTQVKVAKPEEPKFGHCILLFGIALFLVFCLMLIMPR
jgi:hypothetical protein